MLKITILKFAILNVNINKNVEPRVKAAEAKSAKILHFNSKLYVKMPKIEEISVIPSIIKIILEKLKSTKFRFFSIDKLSKLDTSDIKIYPTINENVPIYFGKKNMHKISTAEDIA